MRRIRLRRKKSKAWIIAVILIIVALGFFLFRDQNEPVNQTTEQNESTLSDIKPLVIEDDCIERVVIETYEVPIQVEEELEKRVKKNRTIVPEFEVIEYVDERGGHYYAWEYDQFSDFIENIEISGWTDTKEAEYTSIKNGKNLAKSNITVKNLHGDEANFTVNRFFSLKQKDYYLDGINSMTKTIEKKERFIFDKSILCYYIKDGVPDIKDFIDFLDKYGLQEKDAVVFGKNDRVWGCIRAKFKVNAEEIVEDYYVTKTYTKMVNSTVKKLFNRIISEC